MPLSGSSQKFLPAPTDGLRAYFQPKTVLSPQEEQLLAQICKAGTWQIKKKNYTFYMCFDSKTFNMELYPGRAGQSQDNLPEWNMAFLEDGLRGFPWLHPQSLYPRLPDTPGPLTTQEETLQTPLHLLCCYSRGSVAA